MERAAGIAAATVAASLAASPLPDRVFLVCFGREGLAVHERALADLVANAAP